VLLLVSVVLMLFIGYWLLAIGYWNCISLVLWLSCGCLPFAFCRALMIRTMPLYFVDCGDVARQRQTKAQPQRQIQRQSQAPRQNTDKETLC
jgi:hypothetical protein